MLKSIPEGYSNALYILYVMMLTYETQVGYKTSQADDERQTSKPQLDLKKHCLSQLFLTGQKCDLIFCKFTTKVPFYSWKAHLKGFISLDSNEVLRHLLWWQLGTFKLQQSPSLRA